MTKKIILVLVSIWLGWTVLIDFAVVPAVFRVIKDFFNAGELGINLFSILNSFELIVSSFLFGLIVFEFYNKRTSKLQLLLGALASLIIWIYVSYLTPKLIELTRLWQQADTTNQIGIQGIQDIQQEHQYFHRLYVTLDSVKLGLILGLLGISLFSKEKFFEKA